MDKKNIGFIFNYDENWVGGSYYILNIIHALKTLEPDLQPRISILSKNRNDFKLVEEQTEYQDLSFVQFPKQVGSFTRVVNKVFRLMTGQESWLIKSRLKDIDFVYPNYVSSINNSKIPKVYWIPDFQEEFLPHFFTKAQLKWRKTHQLHIVNNADLVVFSSKNAEKHFKKMYPNYLGGTFVLPFAVTHPRLDNIDFNSVRNSYKLPKKYYFSPNQFWKHKNHITILKSIKYLKAKGKEIVVVFSGKEHDYRNPKYFKSLKTFVEKNNLSNNVYFLGFIDRKDQLIILKNSLAVIQPSLFEGWSTVVEDAKAQNKSLILSNLDIHREQLVGQEATFFEAEDHIELASILISRWEGLSNNDVQYEYEENVKKFGRKFMKLSKIIDHTHKY